MSENNGMPRLVLTDAAREKLIELLSSNGLPLKVVMVQIFDNDRDRIRFHFKLIPGSGEDDVVRHRFGPLTIFVAPSHDAALPQDLFPGVELDFVRHDATGESGFCLKALMSPGADR